MIAIRNLYHMLLYVWDALDEADLVPITADESTDLLDLLARVLGRGTEQLLRRGLDRNYIAHTDAIAGLRGKLELSATLKQNTRQRGQTVCTFDEFSPDVLHNRIIKTTIERVLRTRGLADNVRGELRLVYHRLHEIGTLRRLQACDFDAVLLHRNNRRYRFVLDVCRLIYECLIPEQQPPGMYLFRDFVRDEIAMRELFEKFLREFYKRRTTDDVGARKLEWNVTKPIPIDNDYLPEMCTDITLKNATRTLVIDAKYYQPTLQQSRFGKRTIRSKHLYQLLAYLHATRAKSPSPIVEGMLLYPKAQETLTAEYVIDGFRVRVVTIDLNQRWQAIEAELLALVQSPSQST